MGHKQAQSLMKRRIAAGAVIATGLLGVGLPTASAHTAGDLKASGACQDNGKRLVTYTGTPTNVPASGDGHTATLTVIAILPIGSAISPLTQTVTGNATYTFTQTIDGSVKAAKATAHLVWGDRVTSNASAMVSFTEDCKPVVPPKPDPLVEVTPSDSSDCDARTVTTTTVTTTTDWVLDAAKNVWERATPVVTQVVTTRDATVRECPIIVPPKPDPLVEVTDPETRDCDSRTITTTTVTTTTDWVLDVAKNVWEKATPVVTQVVTTRDATVQECPIILPPKPDPLVEVTNMESTDCDAGEVTTTTVSTTTDWALEDNVWVEATPVVTDDVTTWAATVEECEVEVLGVNAVAPVTVAPVTVAPVEVAANPLPTAAAAGQAITSGQLFAGGLAAFAAFLALGTGFVLRRRQGEV